MDYINIYVDFLKTHFHLDKPLKVVIDSSNGSGGVIIKKLQGQIPNLEIISISDTPHSDFPDHGPNPLVEGSADNICKKVVEVGADFGAILDADGDRVFFIDNEGVMLPSFMTSVLLFKNAQPPFVADELVYKSLQHTEAIPITDVIPSNIGTRYVKAKLKEHDASTASEFSGHHYFKDFFGTDSGIFAIIQVANTMSSLSTSLSDFRKTLRPHEMTTVEIKMGDKKWTDIETKVRALAEQENLAIETREGLTLDNGTTWINIRTSNTEPIMRFIGGSESKEALESIINKLKALV